MFEVNTYGAGYLSNAANAARSAASHTVKYASCHILAGAQLRGSFCVLVIVRTESTGTQRLFSVELDDLGNVKRCISRGTCYGFTSSRKNAPMFVHQLLALAKSAGKRTSWGSSRSCVQLAIGRLKMMRAEPKRERLTMPQALAQSRSAEPMRYSVDFCGSDSPGVNDDCYWGDDYSSLSEALRAFGAPVRALRNCAAHEVAHIFLTKDGRAIRERSNPEFNALRCAREEARELEDDKRERATQAGMAFGCAGFNDAMGH